MTMRERILISKREAAEILSVSVRTIDNLIVQEKIPTRKIGRRVLIPRDLLERFVKDLNQAREDS